MSKKQSHFEKHMGTLRYALTPNADIGGTHRLGCIRATYAELEALLGVPQECDGYKVSGQWVITTEGGDVFTVYDWKMTGLYDDRLPSVEQFRANPRVITFNVGGHDSAQVAYFIEHLSHALDELPAVRAVPTARRSKPVELCR